MEYFIKYSFVQKKFARKKFTHSNALKAFILILTFHVNVARDLLENCDTIKNAHDTRSLVNKKKTFWQGCPSRNFAKLIHGHVFRDTDNKFFINLFCDCLSSNFATLATLALSLTFSA